MSRIGPDKPISDREIVPGDDGEEMYQNDSGNFVCGGKRFKQGCQCEDCLDIYDMRYSDDR